jgi:FkbM family methyltransferase
MRAALKSMVLRTARRLGYTIVADWQRETFQLAEYLQRLFARLRIDCVLDVGAHEGEYHDFLRGACGFAGLIVSFEPNPAAAQVLARRAAADPRWLVENVALGPAAGKAEFHVMAGTQFSSFLRPAGGADAEFDGKNRIVASHQVEVRTVDAVLADLRARFSVQSPYLKLDTQGYDLEVLKGAGNSLPGIPALQTEIYLRRIYQQAPAFDEAINRLLGLGFAVGFVVPTNAASQFPVLCDLDCVMVRP